MDTLGNFFSEFCQKVNIKCLSHHQLEDNLPLRYPQKPQSMTFPNDGTVFQCVGSDATRSQCGHTLLEELTSINFWNIKIFLEVVMPDASLTETHNPSDWNLNCQIVCDNGINPFLGDSCRVFSMLLSKGIIMFSLSHFCYWRAITGHPEWDHLQDSPSLIISSWMAFGVKPFLRNCIFTIFPALCSSYTSHRPLGISGRCNHFNTVDKWMQLMCKTLKELYYSTSRK